MIVNKFCNMIESPAIIIYTLYNQVSKIIYYQFESHYF